MSTSNKSWQSVIIFLLIYLVNFYFDVFLEFAGVNEIYLEVK